MAQACKRRSGATHRQGRTSQLGTPTTAQISTSASLCRRRGHRQGPHSRLFGVARRGAIARYRKGTLSHAVVHHYKNRCYRGNQTSPHLQRASNQRVFVRSKVHASNGAHHVSRSSPRHVGRKHRHQAHLLSHGTTPRARKIRGHRNRQGPLSFPLRVLWPITAPVSLDEYNERDYQVGKSRGYSHLRLLGRHPHTGIKSRASAATRSNGAQLATSRRFVREPAKKCVGASAEPRASRCFIRLRQRVSQSSPQKVESLPQRHRTIRHKGHRGAAQGGRRVGPPQIFVGRRSRTSLFLHTPTRLHKSSTRARLEHRKKYSVRLGRRGAQVQKFLTRLERSPVFGQAFHSRVGKRQFSIGLGRTGFGKPAPHGARLLARGRGPTHQRQGAQGRRGHTQVIGGPRGPRIAASGQFRDLFVSQKVGRSQNPLQLTGSRSSGLVSSPSDNMGLRVGTLSRHASRCNKPLDVRPSGHKFGLPHLSAGQV